MHDDNAIAADLPVMVADYLASTGILDRSLAAIGRLCVAVPLTVARWLGPELKTPDNSPPPRITPTEAGPWTGVVFIEHDEPRFWVFAKSGGRPRQEPIHPRSDAFGTSYDDRYGAPPGARRAPPMWPEQEEPDWYSAPLDPRPWRGGP